MAELRGLAKQAYATQEAMIGGNLNRPTITESLTYRKQQLEEQLEKVNKALEALKANPTVEEVMNLVSQANF